MINSNLPARIMRMPRRRQKIAIKRLLFARLSHLVGQPYSPILGFKIEQIVFDMFGFPQADVVVTPVQSVDHIKFEVTNCLGTFECRMPG